MKTNVSSKVYVPEKTYFDGLFGILQIAFRMLGEDVC